MHTYLKLLESVLRDGTKKTDRTGTGTLSLFGWQSRYPLDNGFPLLTTKTLHFKSIAHELLWFLKGDTNTAYLKQNGVSIWDEWADTNGDLGPIYGKQWRRWGTSNGSHVDQIQQVINTIRTDPNSRRMLVSAWNVGEITQMRLLPCHVLMQFYVVDDKLSCQLYQRSADIFLGLPFNIASYALLLKMMAQICKLGCGELIHTLGDAHLYCNHIEQAQKQLRREPKPLPSLRLNPDITDLFAFRYEDIVLQNYEAHGHIQAPVAV